MDQTLRYRLLIRLVVIGGQCVALLAMDTVFGVSVPWFAVITVLILLAGLTLVCWVRHRRRGGRSGPTADTAGTSRVGTHPEHAGRLRRQHLGGREATRPAPAHAATQIAETAVGFMMRASDPAVNYLVGAPKGRLSRFEQALCAQDWQGVRDHVAVKLIEDDGELYVPAKSQRRISNERGIRRRRLKMLWRRLHELKQRTLTTLQLRSL